MARRWRRAPRRSATALRNEWGKREAWAAAEESGSSDSGLEMLCPEECSRTHACSEAVLEALDSVAAFTTKATTMPAAVSAICPVVRGVACPQLPWLEPTASIRQDWSGRSWARACYAALERERTNMEAALDRALQPTHAALSRALRLDEAEAPHRLLFCDMSRARTLWEQHLIRTGQALGKKGARAIMASRRVSLELRAELKLVQYAEGATTQRPKPLPTLLASGFRRTCIGGPAASGVHYVGPGHVMAWMGLTAGGALATGVAAHAKACLKPRALMRAAGNSMALQAAAGAVASGFALLGAAPRGEVRVVSLYAGAFDAFLRAMRWVQQRSWPHASVMPLLAAEAKANRRAVLRRTQRYVLVLKSAKKAAALKLQRVTVLTATPDCPAVSKARLQRKATGEDRGEHATNAMRRFTGVMIKAIVNMQPRLVLIEQVEGLATHYPHLLREFLKLMRAACPTYTWYADRRDAASMGAPHRRKRLILAAVRGRTAA